MSREIAVPFRIGASGGLESTDDPVKQAVFHLMSIVGTNPGERAMRPTYGVPLGAMVFDSADDVHITEMKVRITNAVRAWEPKVQLVDVTEEGTPTDPTGFDGSVIFRLRFRLPANSNIFDATIKVGGTVTEHTTEIS